MKLSNLKLKTKESFIISLMKKILTNEHFKKKLHLRSFFLKNSGKTRFLFLIEISVDRSFRLRKEIVITLRKRTRSKKSSIRRKWWGMWWFYNKMLGLINKRNFLLSKSSSENKNQSLFFSWKERNYRICKTMSSCIFVRIWGIFADGQSCIKEKNSLMSPLFKISG